MEQGLSLGLEERCMWALEARRQAWQLCGWGKVGSRKGSIPRWERGHSSFTMQEDDKKITLLLNYISIQLRQWHARKKSLATMHPYHDYHIRIEVGTNEWSQVFKKCFTFLINLLMTITKKWNFRKALVNHDCNISALIVNKQIYWTGPHTLNIQHLRKHYTYLLSSRA